MQQCLIAFLIVTYGISAFAASAPSTPEGVWSGALEAGRAGILPQAPQSLSVRMTIDRGSPGQAVVTEPKLGINVDLNRSGSEALWMNGYLKGAGRFSDLRASMAGATLSGGGLHIEVSPSEGRSYVVQGSYRDAQGQDGTLNVRFKAQASSPRDLVVRQEGLDLRLRWTSQGYTVDGKADPALYGRRELAIIGAAVAVVTWDDFGP
jgi:hypothetical protein